MMNKKIIKYIVLVGTLLVTCMIDTPLVAADTWEYGALTDKIAASNAGGTKYDTYRQVGLSLDDKNVYIYVSMDPYKYASDDSNFNTGDRDIQLTGYVLTIAGQTIYIDNHSSDYSQLQDSYQNGSKTFPLDVCNSSNYKNNTLSDAATVEHLVRDNGNRMNNIMKLTIPIKALNVGEIPENTQVSLTNNNIWAGGSVSVNYAGASTAPWPLAIVGMLIAIFGYLKLKKSGIIVSQPGERKHA